MIPLSYSGAPKDLVKLTTTPNVAIQTINQLNYLQSENICRLGRIGPAVQLISISTRLDLTNKENMLLIVCSDAVDLNL